MVVFQSLRRMIGMITSIQPRPPGFLGVWRTSPPSLGLARLNASYGSYIAELESLGMDPAQTDCLELGGLSDCI